MITKAQIIRITFQYAYRMQRSNQETMGVNEASKLVKSIQDAAIKCYQDRRLNNDAEFDRLRDRAIGKMQAASFRQVDLYRSIHD